MFHTCNFKYCKTNNITMKSKYFYSVLSVSFFFFFFVLKLFDFEGTGAGLRHNLKQAFG